MKHETLTSGSAQEYEAVSSTEQDISDLQISEVIEAAGKGRDEAEQGFLQGTKNAMDLEGGYAIGQEILETQFKKQPGEGWPDDLREVAAQMNAEAVKAGYGKEMTLDGVYAQLSEDIESWDGNASSESEQEEAYVLRIALERAKGGDATSEDMERLLEFTERGMVMGVHTSVDVHFTQYQEGSMGQEILLESRAMRDALFLEKKKVNIVEKTREEGEAAQVRQGQREDDARAALVSLLEGQSVDTGYDPNHIYTREEAMAMVPDGKGARIRWVAETIGRVNVRTGEALHSLEDKDTEIVRAVLEKQLTDTVAGLLAQEHKGRGSAKDKAQVISNDELVAFPVLQRFLTKKAIDANIIGMGFANDVMVAHPDLKNDVGVGYSPEDRFRYASLRDIVSLIGIDTAEIDGFEEVFGETMDHRHETSGHLARAMDNDAQELILAKTSEGPVGSSDEISVNLADVYAATEVEVDSISSLLGGIEVLADSDDASDDTVAELPDFSGVGRLPDIETITHESENDSSEEVSDGELTGQIQEARESAEVAEAGLEAQAQVSGEMDALREGLVAYTDGFESASRQNIAVLKMLDGSVANIQQLLFEGRRGGLPHLVHHDALLGELSRIATGIRRLKEVQIYSGQLKSALEEYASQIPDDQAGGFDKVRGASISGAREVQSSSIAHLEEVVHRAVGRVRADGRPGDVEREVAALLGETRRFREGLRNDDGRIMTALKSL